MLRSILVRRTTRAIFGLVIATMALASPALAATCSDLERQLVTASSRERDEAQIKRYTGAVERQREEISRTRRMMARAGCSRRSSDGCTRLKDTVSRMEVRASELEALRDSAMGRRGSPARRRAILKQIEEQGCRARGTTTDSAPDEKPAKTTPSVKVVGNSAKRPSGGSGYRTMCVRTCDGYYFPISQSTGSKSFGRDAARCQNMCPLAQTRLFVHPTGSPVETMTDRLGRPYSGMSFAGQHQQQSYIPSKACTCGTPRVTRPYDPTLRGTEGGPRMSVPKATLKQSSSVDAETLRNETIGFTWEQARRIAQGTDAKARPTRIRVVGPRFLPDR